jgi:hypothetical protein
MFGHGVFSKKVKRIRQNQWVRAFDYFGGINGLYTQRYNRLSKTDGSHFCGRYKAICESIGVKALSEKAIKNISAMWLTDTSIQSAKLKKN